MSDLCFSRALHEFQWLSNTTFIGLHEIPVFCARFAIVFAFWGQHTPHLPRRPLSRLVNKDVDAAVGDEEMNARFRREAAYMSGPFIRVRHVYIIIAPVSPT